MDRLAPHIILTLGRSGSNTLVDIINQNPEILNYGEVLGAWMPIRKLKFLISGFSGRGEVYVDNLLRRRSIAWFANRLRTSGKKKSGAQADIKRFSSIRTLGFKEFSMNLARYQLADHILSQPDIRFVGLVRRNALERLISGRRMSKTKQVLVREGNSSKSVSLEIDPETLVRDLTLFQNEHDELDAMLDRVPEERKYVIDYEDLYSDPERTLQIAAEIFAFLGVTPMTPSIRMKKVIQAPMTEVISNYEACRAAVKGTRFEHYFSA